MAHIVSVDAVRERAQQAAAAGKSLHEVQPYPEHTAAGQLFAREFAAAQALRRAGLLVDAEDRHLAHAG